MEGKCVCQVRYSKMKMKPSWKGEENQDEEKKSEIFFKIKGKIVEQSFVYRQSGIFKMRFLLNCLGLDWLPLSRKQSKRDHGRTIRMCMAYSFSFDLHDQRRKKDGRTTPAATRNEVEISSIK